MRRLLVLLALLPACGGGKFDGSWKGTWTYSGDDGPSSSGPITLEISGGSVEGLSAGGAVSSGKISDDGALTLQCDHGRCWPYGDLDAGLEGTASIVAKHLVATDLTVGLDKSWVGTVTLDLAPAK